MTGPSKASKGRRAAAQEIVLAAGLPGSGKSTYFARRGIRPLSSDDLRELLLDDSTDQTNPAMIFATLRGLVEIRLKLGRRTTYVEATSLTPRERRPYILLARRCGAAIRCLYFNIPLETCLLRNQLRERPVPEPVIRRMAHKLVRPTVKEGFTRVTVVLQKKD